MLAKDKITGQFKKVYVKALDSLPIGTILEFPSTDTNKLPVGYKFCDGSAISRTDYSELFALIGTSFGVGDGSTTFNLPDKAGLVSVGIKSSDTDFDTIGETGGSKAQAVTSISTGDRATISGGTDWSKQPVDTNKSISHVQPYIVTNYIIKVKQTIPLAGRIVGNLSDNETDTYNTKTINKRFIGEEVWTNPDISVNFAAQNISISNINNYEYFEIHTLQGINSNTEFVDNLYKDKYVISNYPFYYNNTLYIRSRTYQWSTNKIVVADGLLNGSTNNGAMIPYKIIGYKKIN